MLPGIILVEESFETASFSQGLPRHGGTLLLGYCLEMGSWVGVGLLKLFGVIHQLF